MRLSIFAFATIATAGVFATGDNVTIPAPIVVGASQYFEGNDGPWSTMNMRLGTPQQNVRVLVSTAAQMTLAVFSNYGCSLNVMETIPIDCANSRGLLFNNDTSSTWNTLGVYGFNGGTAVLEQNLGYSTNVLYGLESVGLGYSGNGPMIDSMLLGGIVTATPFYLGIFGLNNQPVNFSTIGNERSPAYISALYSKNLIPSLSWSYTAGASYQLKAGAPMQLIFGGYDTSKFIPNDISFSMVDDITRDLVVYLQSVTFSGKSTKVLHSDPIPMFIDSTDPNIWLPAAACTQFEAAFNLTLDNTTNMYLVSGTQHAALMNGGAQVTFRIADSKTTGKSVPIVLPYAAFARQARYPLIKNGTSYYFPLRRADNASQYTLGRTFLQEAYLTVDYQRQNFSVSQNLWNDGLPSTIVPILPNPTSNAANSVSSSSNTGLSLPIIAAISVGVFLFVLLQALLFYFCLRARRRRRLSATQAAEEDKDSLNGRSAHDLKAELRFQKFELDDEGHRVFELHSDTKSPLEIEGKELPPRHELHDPAAVPEIDSTSPHAYPDEKVGLGHPCAKPDMAATSHPSELDAHSKSVEMEERAAEVYEFEGSSPVILSPDSRTGFRGIDGRGGSGIENATLSPVSPGSPQSSGYGSVGPMTGEPSQGPGRERFLDADIRGQGRGALSPVSPGSPEGSAHSLAVSKTQMGARRPSVDGDGDGDGDGDDVTGDHYTVVGGRGFF